jgi:hypothetical protein
VPAAEEAYAVVFAVSLRGLEQTLRVAASLLAQRRAPAQLIVVVERITTT